VQVAGLVGLSPRYDNVVEDEHALDLPGESVRDGLSLSVDLEALRLVAPDLATALLESTPNRDRKADMDLTVDHFANLSDIALRPSWQRRPRVRAFKTTTLLSIEEGLHALGRATTATRACSRTGRPDRPLS